MTIVSSRYAWVRLLDPIIAAGMLAGLAAGTLRAEGVVNHAGFVDGAPQPVQSLVDSLGDASLDVPVAPAPAASGSRVAPRPASPRERIDARVGSDVFTHLRFALPLVVYAAVGESIDSSLAQFPTRPMSGQMVGIRPHPKTWGSMLDR